MYFMKNTKNVDMDRKYCNIVKLDILRIRTNNEKSSDRNLFNRYFFRSTVIYV